MGTAVVDLEVSRIAILYLLILGLGLLLRAAGIDRIRQLTLACFRMTVQLTLMGYLLLYLFQHSCWWLTAGLVLGMLTFAAHNAKRRVRSNMSRPLSLWLAVALSTGFLVTAALFLFVVVRVEPWYNPQYCVTISSMILGGAMTGLSLSANTLVQGMRERRAEIENLLMLGASPAYACRDLRREAFDTALLPTMNNMMTMGIVTLPGMMTGQLLSGVFPLSAIKYQIAIMLAILACTMLTVMLFVLWGSKTFFTSSGALREAE